MISFRKITEGDLPLILRWRTDPEVTRYMSTDIEFDLEKQTDWYNKVVCTRSPVEHWIISHNEKPVGVLNLEKYDSMLQQTSWGYYIGEMESRIIGGLIPAYFYNYMFFIRDPLLKKINGHLFSENTKVLAMHRFYGVKEVKILKNHVHKYGITFDLILIEMTKNKWTSQRKNFQHYQAVFEE
jgi:UDP-4-amino-4,6-dideoxy-N-acetyl-beta-L-altrosamine N-acetyltransferase